MIKIRTLYNMKKFFIVASVLLIGFSLGVLAQENITVTGIVTDSKKEPLIGVNVVVDNMPGLGTITDVEGNYSIEVPQYQTLVFSYIGYERQEVLVKDKNELNVTLVESENLLSDEIVVTATGPQRKI